MHSSGGPREGSDPIAELLSQLSGVRRAQSNSVPASSSQGTHNVSSQLQQLQMQLQLERQQVRVLYISNNFYFYSIVSFKIVIIYIVCLN